jgi:hypothetical protein
MSRQELADAVNACLAGKDERAQREATLDANHIGKLERGEHRWPNDLRREAFRHVLDAATDAELGFFVIRGLSVPAAQAAQPPAGNDGMAEAAGTTDLSRQREGDHADTAIPNAWRRRAGPASHRRGSRRCRRRPCPEPALSRGT